MPTTSAILNQLRAKANPDYFEGMTKFGIAVANRFGIPVPTMRRIAKETGKDHQLTIYL